MDVDYFDELRKIQRRERKVSLSQIPEDFYESAAKFLLSLESEKKWKERENAYLVIKDIYERRREKIVRAALKYSIAEKPQYMTKNEEKFYNAILEIIKDDEKYFMEILNSGAAAEKIEKEIEEAIEKENEKKQLDIVEEKEKRIINEMEKIEKIEKIEERLVNEVIEKKEKEEKEEKLKIYIEKNIDKFLGLDGKIYGPYREGDVIEVTPEEAKILMKLKVAKEIL